MNALLGEKTILACWSAQGRWSSATQTGGSAAWCVQSTRHGKNHHRCRAVHQHESLPKSVLNSLNSLVSRSQEQNDVTARLRSENLNMRCTCCLLILTMWSASAGCNNRMPMCIGSFSLHSKWIGLSKRDPNSSVLRRDIESDRLIGNYAVLFYIWSISNLFCSYYLPEH